MVVMSAKINLRQYAIFIKPRNFDTAGIKCFSVPILIHIIHVLKTIKLSSLFVCLQSFSANIVFLGDVHIKLSLR